MSAIRSHLRNNLVGYLALFVALGGTSYAAATGSIDSREIKNNTIRGKDIRRGAVSSSDVKNGSLLNTDFKAGQIPAGPRGGTGARGATGARGGTGTPGSALAYAHVNANHTIDTANSKNVVIRSVAAGKGYCLDVTARTAPRNAVATVDVGGAQSDEIVGLTFEPVLLTDCASPTDVLVYAHNPGAAAPVDIPFYIVFN